MAHAIGILGGTFDPVHHGHLLAAVWALTELKLDRVLLIPNSRSPFKTDGPLATFAHRLEMMERATARIPVLVTDDIEGRRGGMSYMVDTLRELSARESNAELTLILGADALADISLWKDHQTVTRLARVVGIKRGGENTVTGEDDTRILTMPRIDISSTMIRERLAAGKSIDFLTPAPVVEYIRSQRLYTSS